MEKLKRMLSLILCAAMLLGSIPMMGFAAEDYTAEEALQPIYATWVNPLCDIPAESLVFPETQSVTYLGERVYHRDAESAAQEVKAAMLAHADTVTVGFQIHREQYNEEGLVAIGQEIFEAACAHTGVSCEGDYLYWSTYGFEIGVPSATVGKDRTYINADVVFTFPWYTTAEEEEAFVQQAADLLTQLNPTGSDYDKLKTVYDWICANVTYDHANLNDDTYMRKFSAYAALVDRTAVCQGYALLLYRLALDMGIDCRLISGIGNGGGHAWNIIELGGRYYNLDATWDAAWKQAGLDYEYFLKSDENFDDHVRDADYGSESFYAAYPMGQEDYVPQQTQIVAGGTCGDNLTWTLEDEGLLTISGTGATVDYTDRNKAPWYDYRSDINAVVICDGVTSIGDMAFEDCYRLVAIDIPDGVTSIGENAFLGCTRLTEITIPNGVTSIGRGAFGYCSRLTEITIPDGVCSIGRSAFYLCSSLTEITIPESVTSIGDSAFSDCSSLTEITIPESVTSIGVLAFHACSSLTEITIPDGVTSIGDMAFSDCISLTTIDIPDGVTSIGWGAFLGCSSLTDVYYGGSSEEWDMVVIEDVNDPLLSANIHFAGTDVVAVQVNGVTVTENADGSFTAVADVTGGSGFYAYNYWLFDSTGTIVDRHENTFDTSWTFQKPDDGIYLMRVYATDFNTESYSDSSWFAVTSPYENVAVSNVTVVENEDGTYTATADVTGGSRFYAYNYWLFDSTGTIVDRHENTFYTSWTFQKPNDGIYLMRIYATDFTTDAYNDSSWFAVTSPYENVAVSNVTVTENEDGTYTAVADVTGSSGFYAYNYWLFDSTGTIVDRHENTFDTSWTFEKPENGIYLMRIYATDFTTDSHGDGPWFAVAD